MGKPTILAIIPILIGFVFLTISFAAEGKVKIECPICKNINYIYPLSSKDVFYSLEFQEMFLCINCGARRIDDVWYTSDEWDAKLKQTQEETRIKQLKSYHWTDKRIARVLEGYIYIGDTSEIVREAWGGPEDINRTITAYGTDEQWVYGLGNYVYFRNGKVTAISD